IVDEIRCGAYRQLWKPNCLITGKEDAANNFGRGNCTVGKHKMEETLEAIRKLVEDSNNLAAFELVHSHSGGTGSGFTTLITDQLCDEYGKKFKFGTSVFPSAMYSQSTVDPYNAILHAHSTIDTLDCDILVDNQTLFDRCTKNLSITQPSFSEINRLLAQMLSSLFLSHRFIYHGSQHADTTELLTNLIPYPRIHFPSLFYAPLVPRNQMEHDAMTVQELTRAVFNEEAQTIDFPCRRNAYISCAMLYRGVNSPKQVYDALQVVKATPSIGATFVDWCPTGFKVGLNSYPPVSYTHSPLAQAPRSVCMLAGNLGMREAWHRNNLKFDVLFSRRCFVHWFIGEGIEESEFIEARDDMAYLEQDYTELMSEVGSPPEPEVPVETNESNPVHELDSINPRLNAKQELQDLSSTHIRQSNNANIMQTSDCYRGYHIQQHPMRTNVAPATSTRYHPGPDLGDNCDSMGHRNVPSRSYDPHAERIAMSNRVGAVNHSERPQWSAQPYDSAHLDDLYCRNERRYYDDASASVRESSAGYHRAHLWSRGDDRASVTDGHPSIDPVTSELQDHTSEVTSPNRPRDLNMNYPKISMAGSDSTFLPTEPIVRACDSVYLPDDMDRYSTEYPPSCRWSPTSNQVSGIPEPKTRASYSQNIGRKKLSDCHLGRTSMCSNVGCHGQVPYAESVVSRISSRSLIQPPNLSQIPCDPNGNLTDDDDVDRTDCSGQIATRSPSEATIESPRITVQNECVTDSGSSGFGTMSSVESNSKLPVCSRQPVANKQQYAQKPLRSVSQSYNVNREKESTIHEQPGRHSRHHHHRHHHHHHQHEHQYHHHYYGSHAHPELSRRYHHSQGSNRMGQMKQMTTDRQNFYPARNNSTEDYNHSTSPHGDQEQTIPAAKNVTDARISSIAQGHYRSSSMVTRLPIYEVSVSSSPERERAANTPILSAWSASENGPKHTPIAHY
ncbi:Alpha-tubulin, partial [Fasciolopsis buskii]